MSPFVAALLALRDGRSLVLGSGGGSDVIVSGDGVDSQHARVECRGGSLYVNDLDSCGGTFVNDVEVRGAVALRPGDRLRLAGVELMIPDPLPGRTDPTRAAAGAPETTQGLAVALDGVTKRVTVREGVRAVTREILSDVTIAIRPGEFVGILGASGSGKSTLMNVLAGNVEPSVGRVLIHGRAVGAGDLRRDRRVAYLPQDVVIHEALTSLVALGYIAGWKNLAEDIGGRRRAALAALDRVGLGDRGDVAIRRLSGGQRKRVALAAELMGDPGLILLDEATSGLDPATEGEMMQLFRELATEGRTVVCITHFPGRLDLCNRLIVVAEGRLVFCGTPEETRGFFGVRDIEDVFSRQRTRPAEQWQGLFLNSPAGLACRTATREGGLPQADRTEPLPEHERPSSWRQAADLTARYARIQLSDPRNLLLLLAQAPAIALLIGGTFGDIRVDFAEQHAADTKLVAFLLVVAVLWCAGTGSVREIVKELPILRHERRMGVDVPAYLLSKFVVLGILALAQAMILLVIVRGATRLTGVLDVQFVVLGLTALAGVGLGLAISALSATSERAMTVLPVVLIGQAIFSGGLARLTGWSHLVGLALAPAYWALDGLRATLATDLLNATYPGAPGHYQPPILGPGGPLPVDLLALAGQLAVLLIAAHGLLAWRLGEGLDWVKRLVRSRGPSEIPGHLRSPPANSADG
jgi:ABC-type multidrug transport system ATPase subunit